MQYPPLQLSAHSAAPWQVSGHMPWSQVIGGGPPLTQTVVGTENLNSDCTGTITYDQKINGQQGPPLDITFFVSDEGDRIDGLVVDPGTVFSCELHRTSKND